MPECLATLWTLLGLLPGHGWDVLWVVVEVLVPLQQLLLTERLPEDNTRVEGSTNCGSAEFVFDHFLNIQFKGHKTSSPPFTLSLLINLPLLLELYFFSKF